MKKKLCLISLLSLLFASFLAAQSIKKQAGSLFIIGGGDRSSELMEKLVNTTQLSKNDYIVVLPMSGAEPDTSFFYIQRDLAKVCSNTIANLNFTQELVKHSGWLDSLRKAKLVFITGGDQNRFMKIVLHTPVQEAITEAWKNGATIAGTSAGAAVMSKQMITGNEYSGDSVRPGTFDKLRHRMVELKEGLGLVTTAIIDQHFIARSRYNRLIAVLADNPADACIGIDEGTAIIIKGKDVTVTGIGQVIRFTLPFRPKKTMGKNKLLNLRNARMDVFTSGDSFQLK